MKNMVQKLGLTVEQAMDVLNIPESERETIRLGVEENK